MTSPHFLQIYPIPKLASVIPSFQIFLRTITEVRAKTDTSSRPKLLTRPCKVLFNLKDSEMPILVFYGKSTCSKNTFKLCEDIKPKGDTSVLIIFRKTLRPKKKANPETKTRSRLLLLLPLR